MAGCLPTLVQIPFFLALWQAIRRLTATEMGQDSFLWIAHIAQHDRLLILPVLAAVAQFFQTRMAMQPRSQVVDAQQRQMNMIMQFMPLMVILFGLQVPAGAVLYWTVSSVFSAVMQYFVTGWGSLSDLFPFLPRKQLKSLLPAPRAADAPPAKPGRFQRFQDRMMELQQQQQEVQKQKSPQAQGSPVTPPARSEYQASVDEVSAPGNTYTEDAWQLPGAPGTTGRTTAFAAGTAGGNGAFSAGNGSSNGRTDRETAARQRPNGNRKKKRK
jgi:YidC/Oxa1 family membrane protein insertase